ncbi:MAG: PrpR N-terminal domain-containing protein [Oscillospiraceae bacterium]
MPESGKMRILVVSPYEGFAEAVSSIVSVTEEFTVTYVSGDLGEGVEAARAVIETGFDVIMSRGGTSELLEAAFPLPVVNVEVSGYDFVRVIKLAQGNSGKAAIVGFSKITDGASVVCELLRSDLEIFTVGDEHEVGSMMDRLMREGYSIIIGDNVTVMAARRRGMNGILVTSGRESILKALDEATRIYDCLSVEKRRSALLEKALRATCPAGALTDGGKTIFSWGTNDSPVADMARNFSGGSPVRRVVESGGLQWRAEAVSLDSASELVTARLILRAADGAPTGITFKEGRIGETAPFSAFSANDEPFHSTIERAESFGATDAPLYIWGAKGTGKTALAYAIHLSGGQKSEKFLTADCSVMPDGSWTALLAADETILSMFPAGTLYLKNIEDVPEKWTDALLSALCEDGKLMGWRTLASSSLSPDALRGKSTCPSLARRLSAFSIRLPRLSERKEAIGDISSLMISEANDRYGKAVVALDPEALKILAAFPWYGNISELREVVTELVITSRSPYISPEAAKSVLEHRRCTSTPADICISRGQNLDEIEAEIIRRVLCEEGGNQSIAAKRLGISRSTLWRKNKENA